MRVREGARLHTIKRRAVRRDGLPHEAHFLGDKPLRLGRRREKEDPRDRVFSRPRTRAFAFTNTTYRTWSDLTWQGDQGDTSQCEAYSALHRIENSPRTYPVAGPVVDPSVLYALAQQNDEWEGEDYDGTSGRGMAKALLTHQLIMSYERVMSLGDLVDVLMNDGPVQIGTNWHEAMFSPVWKPDAEGVGRWTLVVEGNVVGGHAWLLNGVNQTARVFRMLNSWGPSWGIKGRAWVSFDTVDKLVFQDGGEAFRYVEVA